MNFTLIPFEGTDRIKLGMTSSEIQSMLQSSPEHQSKSEWALYDKDYFGFVSVEYNDDQKSISFEFSSPAKVFFQDIQLIGENYHDIENLFKTLDENLIIEEGAGFTSVKYQIGVYAPNTLTGHFIETVLVAQKSYYDFLLN